MNFVAGAESALAIGREVDDAGLLVDALDVAHVELATGHLTDELCLLAVVEIDVIAPVALAGPQDATPVGKVVAVEAVVVHILVVGFLDEGSHLAGQGIQLQQAVGLVTAFVEGEGEGLAVVVPLRGRDVVLLAEEVGGRLHDTARGHLDDDGHAVVERVAGLGILLLVEHGLHGPQLALPLAVDGHRLHVVDIALRGGLDADGGIVAAIGRESAPGGIVVGGVAVGGQLTVGIALSHPEVVVAVEDEEGAVGG